jgi:hypothetical protein
VLVVDIGQIAMTRVLIELPLFWVPYGGVLEHIMEEYMTAAFRNSEFATTIFQVHRCMPIYLAAIPIPLETHILFYIIPLLFLLYSIATFPRIMLIIAAQ